MKNNASELKGGSELRSKNREQSVQRVASLEVTCYSWLGLQMLPTPALMGQTGGWELKKWC